MPEKEPQFTVSDRRKFTLEGELREDEAVEAKPSTPTEAAKAPNAAEPPPPHQDNENGREDAMPEPTAEESAQQTKDYNASTRQLDDILSRAASGSPALPTMNFDRLVQSIYMTAAMQMGAGTAPDEQPRIDVLGARQSIDMLGVLEEKTKGNLTEDEKRLLQSALFDLRMSFLEITNAINKSAQQAPKPGKAK
jgi:hypothetical protein